MAPLVSAVALVTAALVVPTGSVMAVPSDFPCVANDGWDHSPTYRIDATNAPGDTDQTDAQIVRDAIQQYWDRGTSVVPGDTGEAGGTKATDWIGFDGEVNVPGDIEISWGDLPPGVLGRATCVVNGGAITEATVVLTDDENEGLSNADKKNVAAHELGHAIGLNHKGAPGTLMHKFIYTGLGAYRPLAKASVKWLDRNY